MKNVLYSIPIFALTCSLAYTEGVILVPQFGKKEVGTRLKAGGGGGVVSVTVDRAEDGIDQKEEKKTPRYKTVTYVGTVIDPKNEYDHIKVDQKIGKGTYLALAADSRAVKDVIIQESSLEKEDQLAVVGYKRGYVGGLPKEAPRRRILGATFIFKIGEQTLAPEENQRPQAGVVKGSVLSTNPLVIVDEMKNLYEVRPALNCRIIHIQQASWGDIEEGVRVRASGHEEKIILRPKGKTISRYVFQTESLRVLAPELKDSDYQKFENFNFAK
ncbi:MAG: hypothetical protein O3B01_23940 [Planctomycetota bacterium]|nr:hypothetical protein [Planctomycetota bacterium]MDA1141625.1 hypothetical protein [Planctomycetota bacterium]